MSLLITLKVAGARQVAIPVEKITEVACKNSQRHSCRVYYRTGNANIRLECLEVKESFHAVCLKINYCQMTSKSLLECTRLTAAGRIISSVSGESIGDGRDASGAGQLDSVPSAEELLENSSPVVDACESEPVPY